MTKLADRPDPAAFGRNLGPGLGVNLLVADVAAAAAFQQRVLGARLVWCEADFAILSACGAVWMLHGDRAYRDHPLGRAVAGEAERGAGVELRLYGSNPDDAVRLAEAAGGTVLSPPLDKPHGLREAHIIDPEGYVWVLVAMHWRVGQFLIEGSPVGDAATQKLGPRRHGDVGRNVLGELRPQIGVVPAEVMPRGVAMRPDCRACPAQGGAQLLGCHRVDVAVCVGGDLILRRRRFCCQPLEASALNPIDDGLERHPAKSLVEPPGLTVGHRSGPIEAGAAPTADMASAGAHERCADALTAGILGHVELLEPPYRFDGAAGKQSEDCRKADDVSGEIVLSHRDKQRGTVALGPVRQKPFQDHRFVDGVGSLVVTLHLRHQRGQTGAIALRRRADDDLGNRGPSRPSIALGHVRQNGLAASRIKSSRRRPTSRSR